jgi:phosphatidylethanolamine-binding protein (PEBP) family uncharacterized protein
MSSKHQLARMAVAGAAVIFSAGALAMNLSFDWGPTAPCFDPKSPPIKLGDVPDGTKELRFKMVDLDAPHFDHGGGTVKYAGKDSLPYGTFQYKGPCPPSPHTYEISIEALDAGGNVLAEAKARKRFP